MQQQWFLHQLTSQPAGNAFFRPSIGVALQYMQPVNQSLPTYLPRYVGRLVKNVHGEVTLYTPSLNLYSYSSLIILGPPPLTLCCAFDKLGCPILPNAQ